MLCRYGDDLRQRARASGKSPVVCGRCHCVTYTLGAKVTEVCVQRATMDRAAVVKVGAAASASLCALFGGVALAQYIVAKKKRAGKKTRIIEMVSHTERERNAASVGVLQPAAAVDRKNREQNAPSK